MEHSESTNLLSAEWINQRYKNASAWAIQLWTDILVNGFFESGYLPLDEPIDKEVISHMDEAQFDAMMTASSPDEQAKLMQMAAELDMGS